MLNVYSIIHKVTLVHLFCRFSMGHYVFTQDQTHHGLDDYDQCIVYRTQLDKLVVDSFIKVLLSLLVYTRMQLLFSIQKHINPISISLPTFVTTCKYSYSSPPPHIHILALSTHTSRPTQFDKLLLTHLLQCFQYSI